MRTRPHRERRHHASAAPQHRRRRGGHPGFSLVEVLVAMILLAITAVSVATYTATVATTRVLARQKAYAMVAVRETLDSVRTLGFQQTEVGFRQSTRTIGGLALTVRATVALSQSTTKVVDVSVVNNRGVLLQRFITSLYDETR